MKLLFVHQNFPGQFRHLASHLGGLPGNEVNFVTQRAEVALPGVRKLLYHPHRQVTPGVHRYLRDTEAGVLNAQAVARCSLELKKSGFVPDLMVGHNGWGEIWYLKDVFPSAPLLGYFEFFYRPRGADVAFDAAEPVTFDTAPRVRTKNLGNLIGLEACDRGVCPTHWQKSGYPKPYQPMLEVIHEGIDTRVVRPDSAARLSLPGGITCAAGDEILTYVARNLEPYRGFPSFMRSLPAILAARPRARVLIVGGDEVSYGAKLAGGRTFREQMLDELGASLDLGRVHFLGRLPYPSFLKVLQVSRTHVYLTYPFVLSWSLLEAMAAGCCVVASRTAPVEEVIRDGENGVLVDFFKPDELAARVIEALAEAAAFAVMRAQARETVVSLYDLHAVALPAQIALLKEMAS